MSAPLPAEEFRVDPDIRVARTLSPRAFIDPAVLEAELATIFRTSWLLVPDRTEAELRGDPRALAELVAVRGTRAPATLLDAPLYLQRDFDGTLRAFPNVCTHAWHTLVHGPERGPTVTCPQHGRKFDCLGRFVSQPGFEACPEFPGETDHLRTLPVHEWGPLLFASLGKPATAFAEMFAPIRESLARFPLDALQRAPMAGETREVNGNWKQHAWNYMDKFHIPFLHRKPGGLSDALDLASYRTELHADSALQWAFAKNPAHGFDPALLPARFTDPTGTGRRVFALWWLVFPNLALNFYPWGLSVNAWMPVAGKPTRTRFHWYHFVLDEAKHAQRDEVWQNRDVDLEDVDAMTQVARGVASGLASRGRFAPGEEDGPHWFHRRVYEALVGDTS